MLLIAISAVSTGAAGQGVYRCGNSYGQKPCTDAVLVDVQDSRTTTQKAESDANVQREAATANAMEKARLKADAQRRADAAREDAELRKKAATKPGRASSAPADGDMNSPQTGAKKSHTTKKKMKKKEPQFFTARAAAEKPKPSASASKGK